MAGKSLDPRPDEGGAEMVGRSRTSTGRAEPFLALLLGLLLSVAFAVITPAAGAQGGRVSRSTTTTAPPGPV
ncbi:hypothetical protein [Kitasatospora sp. MAP5-34]|uniref:hypothetical protein n=1 Tax=Kitasatospora sp. MAP5-34 TaxID=3035102 RepID=UPI0024745B2B|nr:hypothetical protein [Kitasatospora sp. MAP5-34]MDH6575903.1 hypothetical protein [Kitasatospora sp. MAP5-34]